MISQDAIDRASRNLGSTQVLVLQLLALQHSHKTARDLAMDWPGLTQSSVGSALRRLGDRGLVDMAGWDPHRQASTYKLTEKGAAVELKFSRIEGLEDEDDG